MGPGKKQAHRLTYFVPFLGEKFVHELDQSDVVALRNHLKERGLSPKSIRNALGLLFTM